ncbi:ArsC/Spx/MgsR family protein [Moraxella marmotae]|uniref:ArsC/Spx/MgsR family protein n=1 Tax=Moraxella marmotae TaxID=3344520 RepID=UPI0035F4F6FD
MAITVYGIKNCNTMKKAFDKLGQMGVAYEFFDYKKQVLSAEQFAQFVAIFGEKVINKQGTTYRKLDDDQKAIIAKLGTADDLTAVYDIVKANQSVLKRPIILGGSEPVLGFDDEFYQKAFG